MISTAAVLRLSLWTTYNNRTTTKTSRKLKQQLPRRHLRNYKLLHELSFFFFLFLVNVPNNNMAWRVALIPSTRRTGALMRALAFDSAARSVSSWKNSAAPSKRMMTSLLFSVPQYRRPTIRNVRLLSPLWLDAVNGDSFSTSFSSSTTSTPPTSFDETPLGSKGRFLLKGLDVYSVPASGDGHPLAVYGIQSTSIPQQQQRQQPKRQPILLLHGRTWSAVPVYHLHPEGWADRQPSNDDGENESSLESSTEPKSSSSSSRSLMEALWQAGLQPYCMDFRGFGGTPYDTSTGYVEPNRCVEDTETVLEWIAQRHGVVQNGGSWQDINHELPALLGWSQGALIAQLVAQRAHNAATIGSSVGRPHQQHQQFLSKLILYGSIYDPLVRYPREPLYTMSKPNRTIVTNTFDDAIEDFTLEGSIPPEAARQFAYAALITDPIKAQWRHLYQFNNCDPARIVHLPTLVIAGDQDPYAPLHVQQELFANLGRGSDRTWSILADCDHAVHLLEGRHRMITTVVSFVLNG